MGVRTDQPPLRLRQIVLPRMTIAADTDAPNSARRDHQFAGSSSRTRSTDAREGLLVPHNTEVYIRWTKDAAIEKLRNAIVRLVRLIATVLFQLSALGENNL